jgi:hypothetical protein
VNGTNARVCGSRGNVLQSRMHSRVSFCHSIPLREIMTLGQYSKFHLRWGTESLPRPPEAGQLAIIPSKAGYNFGIQKAEFGSGNANRCTSIRLVLICGKIDDSASQLGGLDDKLTRLSGRGNSEAPDCQPHPQAAP